MDFGTRKSGMPVSAGFKPPVLVLRTRIRGRQTRAFPGPHAQILALQASAGNRAVVGLMSPARAEIPSKPGIPQVQRRVGFEFEERNWNAFFATKVAQPGKKKTVLTAVPAKRKDLLWAQPAGHFNLEADDSFGASTPTMEFVTKPFDPTQQGLTDLTDTFLDIRKIMAKIGPYAGRTGVSGDTRKDSFVTDKKHKLGASLWLSQGNPSAQFKMQATSGSSLEELPMLMEYFGSNAPGETQKQQARRSPARRLMYGDKRSPDKEEGGGANKVVSDMMGAIPSMATGALAQLQGIKPLIFAHGDALRGLLAALLLYVKMLSIPETTFTQAKYFIPLLARTDFATIFKLLPQEQRKALRKNDAALLVNAVVTAANSTQILKMRARLDQGGGEYYADTNFQSTSPLVRAPGLGLQSLTIEKWVKQFTKAKGPVDLMNAETFAAWLSRKGGTLHDVAKAKASLESFAVLGNDPNPSKTTDTADIAGHSPLTIFENRLISDYFDVERAYRAAYNYLAFFKKIKDSAGNPKKFPTLDPP